MEQDNERPLPTVYPQIPMESRIRYVSETDPEIFHRPDIDKLEAVKEYNMTEIETHQPAQSELHQTAEILCKLSDSPTIHLSPASDPLSFLTEATRYTIHPVYSPVPFPYQGIISYPLPYPTFIAHPYPLSHSTAGTTTTVTAIELGPPISEEEWMTLTSPELPHPVDINTCGSPVVEEFLQTYLPLDTPAEDRQGWYEFLCEDGENEDCWTKFLGSDSGAEIHHKWLEDSGYEEEYQKSF